MLVRIKKRKKKNQTTVYILGITFFFYISCNLRFSCYLNMTRHRFKPYWFYFPQPAWTCALPSIGFVLLENQEHRLLVKMSALKARRGGLEMRRWLMQEMKDKTARKTLERHKAASGSPWREGSSNAALHLRKHNHSQLLPPT